MDKIHTHYDNLKVTRNAPVEVIRAAYKILAQKYHPDKHPGKPDALRVMALINGSYEVLSNPAKRAEHDRWIAQQEREAAAAQAALARRTAAGARASAAPPPPPPYPTRPPAAQPRPASPRAAAAAPPPAAGLADGIGWAHVRRYWSLYALAALLLWLWATRTPKPAPAAPSPFPVVLPTPAPPRLNAPPQPQTTRYERPPVAPNGELWPDTAGYVAGYPLLNRDGLSTVTVDNGGNAFDVFVKLVALNGAATLPVRQFYIPAFGSFTLGKITAGSYDIRYRDLSTGSLARSERFSLDEVPKADGTEYTNLALTLYKVKDGNTKTLGLPETAF